VHLYLPADGFLPQSNLLRTGSSTVNKAERYPCPRSSTTAPTPPATASGRATASATPSSPQSARWCMRNVSVPNTSAPALGAHYNPASKSYTLVGVANAHSPGPSTYVRWLKGSGAAGLTQLVVVGWRGVRQCLTLTKPTATKVGCDMHVGVCLSAAR
jgi:hypothetical protein